MSLHKLLEPLNNSNRLEEHVHKKCACAQSGVEPRLPIYLHKNTNNQMSQTILVYLLVI